MEDPISIEFAMENEAIDKKNSMTPKKSSTGDDGKHQPQTNTCARSPNFTDDEVTEQYKEVIIVYIEVFDRNRYHT